MSCYNRSTKGNKKMETLKIKRIDFSMCNACGQVLSATQYYVNGKRKSANTYRRCYGDPEGEGYKWTDQKIWDDKNRNGVHRHHVLNIFTKEN